METKHIYTRVTYVFGLERTIVGWKLNLLVYRHVPYYCLERTIVGWKRPIHSSK